MLTELQRERKRSQHARQSDTASSHLGSRDARRTGGELCIVANRGRIRAAEGIGGRVKFLPLAWAGMPKTSFRKNSDSLLTSTDLYRGYEIWCRRNGHRWPGPSNSFVAESKKIEGVTSSRHLCTLALANTVNGQKTTEYVKLGQPVFIFPPKTTAPTADVALTMGEHVLAFRERLSDYK